MEEGWKEEAGVEEEETPAADLQLEKSEISSGGRRSGYPACLTSLHTKPKINKAQNSEVLPCCVIITGKPQLCHSCDTR